MRKIVAICLACSLLISLAGCAPEWQKKFIRKKKDVKKMPRIYQLKRYEKKPSLELYRKHYVYWETWQSELIEVLGNNSKKDTRCVEEAVGQLKDMQYILVPEKGDKLNPHIKNMEQIRDMIVRGDMTQPTNRDYVKRRLERTDRVVKREFSPNKVKNYIKKDFDEGGGPAAEAAEEDRPAPLNKMSPADAIIASQEAKTQAQPGPSQ